LGIQDAPPSFVALEAATTPDSFSSTGYA